MRSFFLVAFFVLLGAPAFAQETPAKPSVDVNAAGEAPAQEPQSQEDMGSLERRVELAAQMHKFRSSREQVDSAVATLAQRMAPERRELFRIGMRNVLNYKAIEKVSIDAMAETFTEKELAAMVEYYSKPEARSVSEKYPQYQAKVSPAVTKMIDKAMMQVKTGASGQ